MEGQEETQEEEEVLGKPISEMTAEDFETRRAPWVRRERNNAAPARVPLEYRLAAAYFELRNRTTLSTFVHYKRELSKGDIRELHHRAASYYKYIPTGTMFPYADRNDRTEGPKRKRINFIARQQRHMQAIARNCFEGTARAMRAGNTELLGIFTDIQRLACGSATDLRGEMQYLTDPERARASKKQPQGREKPFDDEDDRTIDANLAEKERLDKLHRRQLALERSNRSSFFGGRQLGGSRGRKQQRSSSTSGRNKPQYRGASNGGGSSNSRTWSGGRNRSRNESSDNNRGWKGGSSNSNSNSKFGKSKFKFNNNKGGKGRKG
jgi:hypothetical protein